MHCKMDSDRSIEPVLSLQCRPCNARSGTVRHRSCRTILLPLQIKPYRGNCWTANKISGIRAAGEQFVPPVRVINGKLFIIGNVMINSGFIEPGLIVVFMKSGQWMRIKEHKYFSLSSDFLSEHRDSFSTQRSNKYSSNYKMSDSRFYQIIF